MTAISRSVLEEQLAIIRKELDKMETDYQKISDQSVQSFLMYKEGKVSLQAYLDAKKECSDWETRKHDGCNILRCGDGALDGKYFTDRGNGTHGRIQLIKTESIDEEMNTEKEF